MSGAEPAVAVPGKMQRAVAFGQEPRRAPRSGCRGRPSPPAAVLDDAWEFPAGVRLGHEPLAVQLAQDRETFRPGKLPSVSIGVKPYTGTVRGE